MACQGDSSSSGTSRVPRARAAGAVGRDRIARRLRSRSRSLRARRRRLRSRRSRPARRVSPARNWAITSSFSVLFIWPCSRPNRETPQFVRARDGSALRRRSSPRPSPNPRPRDRSRRRVVRPPPRRALVANTRRPPRRRGPTRLDRQSALGQFVQHRTVEVPKDHHGRRARNGRRGHDQ